jgi:hypothetical protein
VLRLLKIQRIKRLRRGRRSKMLPVNRNVFSNGTKIRFYKSHESALEGNGILRKVGSLEDSFDYKVGMGNPKEFPVIHNSRYERNDFPRILNDFAISQRISDSSQFYLVAFDKVDQGVTV